MKLKKAFIKILLLSSIVSFAKVKLGVQSGLTHGGYSLGFGGSVFVTSQISEKFSFGAKAGYYTLGKETISDPNAIYSLIMTKSDGFLQMVCDYYLIKKKKVLPFVGIGTGFHFYSKSNYSSGGFGAGAGTSIMLLIGISPSIGFDYTISEKISLRVSYIYSLLFSTGKKRDDIYTQTQSNISVYSTSSILIDHYGQLNVGVVFKF